MDTKITKYAIKFLTNSVNHCKLMQVYIQSLKALYNITASKYCLKSLTDGVCSDYFVT